MKRLLLLTMALTLGLMPPSSLAADKQVVTILPPYNDQKLLHHYFSTLLSLVLRKGDPGEAYEIRPLPTIDRAEAMLELVKKGGALDVAWAADWDKRTKRIHAIPIPTLGGLMGYRSPIIKYSRVEEFRKVKSIEDLQKYKACSGTTWADSDVLRKNGLQVLAVRQKNMMFWRLQRDECDYFPRSVVEGGLEMVNYGNEYPDLIFFRDLVIHYDLPIYFYVSYQNDALHTIINRGMSEAEKDGSLQRLLQSHPLTRGATELMQTPSATLIELRNER